MELQIVDYIMLALLVLMTIMGLMRGIVRQIGDLAALILGVVGANIWGGEASLWVQTHTQWSLLASQITAYITIFLIIYLTVRIVAGFIKSLTQLVKLGWIDSIAGGLFAAFKTVLLVSILLDLAMLVTKDADWWNSPAITQSVCFETVRDFAPHILNLVWQQPTIPTP